MGASTQSTASALPGAGMIDVGDLVVVQRPVVAQSLFGIEGRVVHCGAYRGRRWAVVEFPPRPNHLARRLAFHVDELALVNPPAGRG